MVADEGKRAKLEEAEAEGINGELVASVEKLQDIQDELEKINEEESEKVLEVEQECNESCRPVYSRRNEIIQSIPDFWLTAFLNHPVLGELLSEKDQKIFKHLVSLDVEDFKDSNSGYSITFNFSANPYFEDKKLTKTYSFDKGIMGTTIKWKEGISIVNGVPDKKKGSKRPHAAESFFSWFHVGQQEDLSEGIFDEVAVIIKEDLWPNPLIYFNNEVDEEDFDGAEEEEEEDDDEYHNEEKGTDGNEDEDEDNEDNN